MSVYIYIQFIAIAYVDLYLKNDRLRVGFGGSLAFGVAVCTHVLYSVYTDCDLPEY